MADGSWYRAGKVSLAPSSQVVAGSSTFWVGQTQPGDIFTTDGVNLYEIVSVDADDAIRIYPAWAGAQLANAEYSIVRVWGRVLPDQLAARVAGLVEDVRRKLVDPLQLASLIQEARDAKNAVQVEAGKIATLVGQANAAIAETEDLLKQVGALMPVQYWFNADGVAGTTRATVLQNDPYLTKFRIQNLSKTEHLAVGLGGRQAEPFGVGITLAPGQMLSEDYPQLGSVTVKATAGNVPFTCDFANTSGINPNAASAADALLLRFPDFAAMPSGWKDAIRTLYIGLYTDGTIQRASDFHVFGSYSQADALVNWARSSSSTAAGSPAWTKAVGFTLDGVDDYIDTGHGLVNSDRFATADHAMFCEVDTGGVVLGANHPCIGCGTVEISPNRTATSFAIKDGSATADVVSGAALDGFFGLNRQGPAGYTAYQGASLATGITRTFDTLTSYNLLFGVRPTLGGAVTAGTYFAGKIKWGYCGLSLSATQISNLRTRMASYFSTVAGL